MPSAPSSPASEPVDYLKTVRDYIRFAASEFARAGLYFGHGTDNAWDEAAYLVLHTLYLPQSSPPHVLDARLTREERLAVYSIIRKRIEKRLPAPYITHEAWFAGLPFYVDERVLIPRSGMAELIAQQFAPWWQPPESAAEKPRILEIGTGSGCIAIACAEAFPEADIIATDISREALAVAHINLDKHADRLAPHQIELLESDLFSHIPFEASFDLIISNPPYVDAEDMADLPPEYQHEPRMALAAGKDGLDIVRRLLQEAGNYLADGGLLVVEVGNSAAALMDAYPQMPFVWPALANGDTGIFLLTKENLNYF